MLSAFRFGRSLSRRLGLVVQSHTRNTFEENLIPLIQYETRSTSTLSRLVNHRNIMTSVGDTTRALSMPAISFARDDVTAFQRKLEPFTLEEKLEDDKDEPKPRTRRKFGVFLTGAAVGGIAKTFWTYGQLKEQSDELSHLDGQKVDQQTRKSIVSIGKVLHAAESFTSDQIQQPRSGGVRDHLGGKSFAPSRRDRFNFIAEVVEETAPALVYIQIKNLSVRDFYTGEAMTTSNGSGFIVRSDGLILTNAHVVMNKPNSKVLVTLQDGRTVTGVVEDADVGSDLATVRIPMNNLPTMKLGKSSSIRPGEFVIAMGSPLSLTNTITTGVVSSAARNRAELKLHGRNVTEYIQTDAAITFGNSGGPLLNLDGEAIGINSMKLTPGISFAIPIDHAKEFLQKSEENRRNKRFLSKPRKYLGITMVALDSQVVQELRSRFQLPNDVNHGILVFRMVQDSPADRGGMKPGDIITHINGQRIDSTKDVYKLLEDLWSFRVDIFRNGRRLKLDIDLSH